MHGNCGSMTSSNNLLIIKEEKSIFKLIVEYINNKKIHDSISYKSIDEYYQSKMLKLYFLEPLIYYLKEVGILENNIDDGYGYIILYHIRKNITIEEIKDAYRNNKWKTWFNDFKIIKDSNNNENK